MKGVQRILRETGCELVDSPEAAEQILMNGGGRFQDIWPKAFEQIAYFRRKYPLLPLIMGPQVFRVGKVLENIFTQEFMQINPLKTTTAANKTPDSNSQSRTLTCDEEKQIQQQLKDLGYM